MCGHFEAMLYLSLLKGMKLAEIEPAAETRAVAPTLGAPILIREPESREVGMIEARFGLVPSWYRGRLSEWKATTFNARLDSAADKPVFKGAWRYRRCVVPAACFYEWSGAKVDRHKYRVSRADNQVLAFAGLWEEALLAEGELWSFTILTRPAGPDMAAIHDREPCILHPDTWQAWIDGAPVDLDSYTPLKLSDQTAPPLQATLF